MNEVADRLMTQPWNFRRQQQRLHRPGACCRPGSFSWYRTCFSLGPIATQKIEELIQELKAKYTIVIVTHNMQQAARVSDETAFFYLARLSEVDRTDNDLYKTTQNGQRTMSQKIWIMDCPLLQPLLLLVGIGFFEAGFS